jgi:nitrate reductase gamma subunit
MSLFALLKLGVAASALFCLIMLTVLVVRTFTLGRRPTFSHPRGGSLAGILYAFGPGMLPWEKESAGKHLWTYLGGILYHLSILVAMLFLATLVLGIPLSATLLAAARVLLVIGLLCGVALLIKRILKAQMRSLSSGDDYLANILVDVFLLSALMSTSSRFAQTGFLVIAVIVFVYIPFGKLRHCAFFFYSRILFGEFFGRRGVLPHPSKKA